MNTALPLIDQARRYLAAMPGAISGNGGHSQTYKGAVALMHGFQLDRAEAIDLMKEYNQRCSPPWSDRELEHKLDEKTVVPELNACQRLTWRQWQRL